MEYWSAGVLECWICKAGSIFRFIVFQHSNTPSLQWLYMLKPFFSIEIISGIRQCALHDCLQLADDRKILTEFANK